MPRGKRPPDKPHDLPVPPEARRAPRAASSQKMKAVGLQGVNEVGENVVVVIAGDGHRVDAALGQPREALLERPIRLIKPVLLVYHVAGERDHVDVLRNGVVHDGRPYASHRKVLRGWNARGEAAEVKVARAEDLVGAGRHVIVRTR